MVRSNFTFVRMSDDGTTLRINGVSDAVDEILELRLAIAAPAPIDPKNLGSDLSPLAAQVEHAAAAPITEPWSFDVAITPGMFARGDMVLLSGGALRWRPATIKGLPNGGQLELESWIGCTTVLLDSDGKPG